MIVEGEFEDAVGGGPSQLATTEAWTSEPRNRVPGEERDGFDITYARTVTYPEGTTHEDEWFHRFQPQD